MRPVDTLSEVEFAELARRAANLPDAPQALIRAAIDLWPACPTVCMGDVARSALRLIQGALSFDSWRQPITAMGMRGASSDTRHLLFNAMGRDVDLRIHPEGGHFVISGQNLGPDDEGQIELTRHSGDEADGARGLVATFDELGEFRIRGVQAGTYRATLRVGDTAIVLPLIEVGVRS